ncbi:MerR family transcriptional regulator [Nocardioides sp. SYSU DS0651]|uniref:MerR family transcriptional regulator n=1 Tax=Nocardioides sp. SYSU DS0651 TaxID=3415955 RepID=UPI003F4C0836
MTGNDPAASPRETNATGGSAMHIGEVATRTELSIRSLRHWDEVGLVRPSGRSDGGFRLYTEDDVERILLVRRMKPLGFTLDRMAEVLADIEALRDAGTSERERGRSAARLHEVQAEAAERRQRLVRQLAMADEFIGLLAREVD